MAAARKIPANLKVVGAAVVLPLEGGSERYLYRGDRIVADGFDKDAVTYAIDLGLIAEDDTSKGNNEQNADTSAAAE